jgi:division protein CdvB (Snf7/Vps24/ESCRT-III family)
MTAGASYASNVILEKEYDPDEPQVAVSESTEWAEERLSEMKAKLNLLYPWRTKS